MKPKPKSQWWRRLELLQSLNLDAVAEELNRKYLAGYLAELACPTSEERRKKPRLAEMYDAGRLTSLPSYLRAHGGRMKRILIALHYALGNFPSRVIKAAELAAKTGDSLATVHRGLQELGDACLIDAPIQERARATGGNGAARISIVWSNARDLGIAQGIQPTLFEGSDAETGPGEKGVDVGVGARCVRPGNSPGRQQSGVPVPSDHAPTHSEQAPTHGAYAPTHSEQAPTHGAYAPPPENISSHAPARARAIPFSVPLNKPSSSNVPTEEGKKKNFLSPDETAWRAVRERLAAHGVITARGTAEAAREAGWTADQVGALIDECERQTIAGVRAWDPAQVAVHLRVATAGASMRAVKQTVAFQRAKRDRDLALQSKAQASAREADQAAIAAARVAGEALERDHGPELDALSTDEMDALALEKFGAGSFAYRSYAVNRGAARSNPILRSALLARLRERHAGEDPAPVFLFPRQGTR